MEMRNRQLEVEAMHLRVRALELERQPNVDSRSPVTPQDPHSLRQSLDVSRLIALVPPFRESEVDSYFNAFERIAATLNWPKDVWTLLLQCKLVGKAQDVCAALTVEQSLNYDIVKASVLRAYELVPEAYRQKFRNCVKSVSQTYVEFAREKGVLFDKWCHASKTKDFVQLRELVLLEDFKKCLPERIVVYLNEPKAVSLSQAAVFADEFALTHKSAFLSPVRETQRSAVNNKSRSPKSSRRNVFTGENRACYYCHEAGHLISVCPVLKSKEQSKSKSPSAVGLIHSEPTISQQGNLTEVDDSFKPFTTQGFASLTGNEAVRVPITILRDTGAKHSVARRGMLPFSDQSYCGSDLLLWGIKLSVIRAPRHTRLSFLHFVQVAVRDQLPVAGVDLILGNDLAGNKVFPSAPEVTENPTADSCVTSTAPDAQSVFPACVVTRAQARKLGEIVDLSDSFLNMSEVSVSPSSCG
ncbi:hypothetical protein N1851_000121 [Merluccius polli]|uniref:SCAN box domain-containing protein n=1 Tax=Merluccius polli TaxID=89951 RepID=A0AA47NE61_MERPO|nr:hypothetical protein N1851_000121 [Merluccius polli]